jgi:hypothetical protein
MKQQRVRLKSRMFSLSYEQYFFSYFTATCGTAGLIAYPVHLGTKLYSCLQHLKQSDDTVIIPQNVSLLGLYPSSYRVQQAQQIATNNMLLKKDKSLFNLI